MTVCIAAACEESSCVVVAADTMVTNEGIPIQFEHQGRKIADLSSNCIALTAGDALAHTELFNVVQGEIGRLREPSVWEIVATIKKCYQQTRRSEILERVLEPRGFTGFPEFYEAQRHLMPDV